MKIRVFYISVYCNFPPQKNTAHKYIQWTEQIQKIKSRDREKCPSVLVITSKMEVLSSGSLVCSEQAIPTQSQAWFCHADPKSPICNLDQGR